MKKKNLFFPLMFLAATTLGGLTACGDDPDEPVVVKPEDKEEEPEEKPADDEQSEEPNTDITTDAVGWPEKYGGVMLQGFYWDGYDDAQWVNLAAQAEQFNGTFDLVWLPQSGNCGGQSMGYDDLYWFSNYNSSFGTEQELRQLIKTFKDNNIKTIADVVINHRRNVSNWVDFPKETYKGVTYQLTSTDICRDDDGGDTRQWATKNGYELSPNNDSGEGWGGMRDLDHHSENVQNNVKAYLDFLKNDLGYAGFRYDMVKGYSPSFTGMYNATAEPEFSVGECWDGTNVIKNWILSTTVDGKIQSAAFDFQFKYVARNAFNAGVYNRLNQQNDNNWPLISKNQDNGKYRRYAVTFVENHDTEVRPDGSSNGPLNKDTLAANAYMLAMPGTPCVFYKHWLAYPSEIKAMVAARKYAGINNESSYNNTQLLNKVYACIVDQKLQVVIGQTDSYVPEAKDWVRVLSGYHYAYYMPASLETAYADLPSGVYVGTQQVLLSAVTAQNDAKLVYTTDGSEPTASSSQVSHGTVVSILDGATTTLKVGLLVGGKVSGVVSRTYDVRKKPVVEIPSFCTVDANEVCAFYEAPSSWTQTVMCWAWTTSPAENFTSATGTWPGVATKKIGTATNGNTVWKWSWDGTRQNKTTLAQPAMVIFSNGTSGSPQTSDFVFTNGGYYNQKGLQGVVGK